MAGSARRRESGGAASLQGLLEEALGNLNLGGKALEQRASRAWIKIAGPVVGAHTRPETLREGR